MAGTASPRSSSPPNTRALAEFLSAASGAKAVKIGGLRRLRGGAVQENWGFEARFLGGPLDGEHHLVLRTDAPTRIVESLTRVQEFAVLKAAFAAGIRVPEPLFASDDTDVWGKPFLVMQRVCGTSDPNRITGNAALDPLRPALAEHLGRELARIHKIGASRPDLVFLRPFAEVGAARQIVNFRAYLDRHPTPRPVLEWGIRWLETHILPSAEPVLCHHDFRTGNYLVDDGGLTAILDWEFAGWGDRHEDIGWFCCKSWRFARLDREAGGSADREPF
jgi:aminoglycoside phosphotransferase (APT) family kinase protein